MTPLECRNCKPQAMSSATSRPRAAQAYSPSLRSHAFRRSPPCRIYVSRHSRSHFSTRVRPVAGSVPQRLRVGVSYVHNQPSVSEQQRTAQCSMMSMATSSPARHAPWYCICQSGAISIHFHKTVDLLQQSRTPAALHQKGRIQRFLLEGAAPRNGLTGTASAIWTPGPSKPFEPCLSYGPCAPARCCCRG